MADNIFIAGAASGAFAEAYEGLPPWATEDTALSIEATLKKNLGFQTKLLSDLVKKMGGSGQLSPEDMTKLNDELGDLIDNFDRYNRDEKLRNKERKLAHEKEKKAWDKESQIETLKSVLGAAAIQLAINTKQAMIDNVNTYDELTAAGVNLFSGFESATSGFQSLQQLATITGVRFTELSAIIAKSAAAVNVFGIERFARTVSTASRDMFQFGFTAKESAELLGTYLESQRGYTDTRNRSEAATTAGLVRFADRVNKVTLATGMMRSELLANLEALSQMGEATVLSGQIGADASEKTLEFIASFKDKNIGQSFLRMMTDAIKPLNDTFMSFQKVGFGGFGQKLMDFTQSLEGLDAEEAQRRMAEFTSANSSEMAAMVKHATLLRQAGLKAESDDVIAKITGMQQQARAYKAISDEDRKRQKMTSEASKAFKTSWETFLAQVQITFAPLPKILDIFTSGLTALNDFFSTVRGWIGSVEAFINRFEFITAITGKIDLLPWIGIGLAGITALAGLKVAFGVIKYALSMFAIKTTTLAAGVGVVSKSVTWIGSILSRAGSVISAAGKFIASAIKPIGAIVMKFAPILLRLLGPVALLYTAFQIGSAIGKTLHDTLSQFTWFNTAVDSVFSFISKIDPAISTGISAVGKFFSESGQRISKRMSESGAWVSDKIERTGEVFASAGNLASGLFGKMATTVSDRILSIGTGISERVGSLISVIGPKIQSAATSFYDGVLGVKTFFVDTFKNLFSFLGEKFTNWFPWISTVSDFLSAIPNKISEIFSNMAEFGKAYIDSLKEFLFSVMKNFADKMIPDFMKFWKKDTKVENTASTVKSAQEQKNKVFTDESSVLGGLVKSINEKISPAEKLDSESSVLGGLVKSINEKISPAEKLKNESQTPAPFGIISLPELKTTEGSSRLVPPKSSNLENDREPSLAAARAKARDVKEKATDISSNIVKRESPDASMINSILERQTSVLEQILSSANDLVSVNQDILKYSRVNS